MPKRRTSAAIAEAQELLRAEMLQLDELDEPAEDEIARSRALLSEWDELEAEKAEALVYEARMELVRSAALNPANREPGAGTKPGAPYVKIEKDPYEEQQMLQRNMYHVPDVVERAKYAIDQAPSHLNEAGRAHAMRLITLDEDAEGKQAGMIARHMLMTGSKEYHKQFREYMRTGFQGELLRAALSLTDANGGYLVPFTLDPTIILTNSGIADPLRQLATVIQIGTDTWNGVSSSGTTSGWTAEGSEATDGNPTFVQPTITPKRADSFIKGSYEVLADSGFAGRLGTLLADAKARLEGAAFATGNTGATRPRGVVSAVAAVTASIVASAATNAFTRADVDAVADALRPRDAANASWLANKKIYTKIRQFDTAGGSAFWADMGMARPANLLGQPQYEASTMQSAVTTAGLVLLAGDFKKYMIVDRVGMSVQYNPMLMGLTTGRPTGEAGYLAFWRVGADVVDADAFRLLQLNSTAAAVALA